MLQKRDQFANTKLETSIQLQELEDGNVVGDVMDISGVIAIAIFLKIASLTAGSIKVASVQFADDADFTTNITTFTDADIAFMKNDRYSPVSALDQTLINTAGQGSKVSLETKALDQQQFMRVNYTVIGSTALFAYAEVALGFGVEPVVQTLA